jgi:hypothetical protein
MSSKVLHRAENKLPHVDPVWTQRWCADPSLHPQSVQVGNQLCMAIVAEVRGVRRVVGMVQALNKIVQVPVNRRRKMSVEDMAFNDYDVDCLSVFCGQISDLIKQASKKAHIAMAISEDDALGQLLQSYSGTSALTSAEVQSATGAALWRRGLKAAVAVNKFNEMAHSHETHETEPSGIPIMQQSKSSTICICCKYWALLAPRCSVTLMPYSHSTTTYHITTSITPSQCCKAAIGSLKFVQDGSSCQRQAKFGC